MVACGVGKPIAVQTLRPMAKLLDLFLCAQNTLETPELRQLFDQAAARVVQVEALHWCFFSGVPS